MELFWTQLRIVVWGVSSPSGAETSGAAHSHADQELTLSLLRSTIFVLQDCKLSG